MDRDTSFQVAPERESCTVVLEVHRWCFRRDSSREVVHNISGIREDKQHREAEHRGGCQVDRDVLGRLDQDSLHDRWPLWFGNKKSDRCRTQIIFYLRKQIGAGLQV